MPQAKSLPVLEPVILTGPYYHPHLNAEHVANQAQGIDCGRLSRAGFLLVGTPDKHGFIQRFAVTTSAGAHLFWWWPNRGKTSVGNRSGPVRTTTEGLLKLARDLSR